MANGPSESHDDRRRRFPAILARHLLREFMLPFFGTLAAFVMISLLLAVFDDMPDFSGVDIPARMTVLYFLARVPETLLMVFPVSALLAVSFMNGVLGKNNELTAIRSAGLSLLTTATPIWCLAAILSLGVFCLSEFVQPACAEYVETIRTDYLSNASRKKSDGKEGEKAKKKEKEKKPSLNQVAYYNPKNRQEWFFADFHNEGACTGVSICIQDTQGRPTSVLTASQGTYHRDTGTWSFQNANITRYEYPPDGLPLTLPVEFLPEIQPTTADGQRLYRENPRDIAIQSKSMERMPLRDLLRMKRKNIFPDNRTRNLVRTMIAYRIFSPLATLIAILLGFALTLTRGRTTPVKGFVAAVAIFVAYHLLAQFFLVMGKNGHLWGTIAGALPTLLALATALWLTYRRQ